MNTVQGNAKKTNNKSRLSSVYKSQASRKSLSHKEKITNVIKKSTLKPYHESKPRKSYNNNISSLQNTDKKKKTNPYQVNSQRTRSSMTTSSVSRTLPVKKANEKKLQFPFEAIKFKQKAPKQQLYQNKTHDQFYVQYDEPQIADLSLSTIQNSKRTINSHNQRFARYSDAKAKNKVELANGIRNNEFKNALIKLFKFLDPHCTRVISHAEIDYRKVPQAVLYFLGGLFQRIRERNLYLSQKQFIQQCCHIYLRSSNEDVNWFIQEINQIPLSNQPKPKVSNQNTHSLNQNLIQQLREEQKLEPPSQSQIIQPSSCNNLSFQQSNSVISFRKQHKESSGQEYVSRGSIGSQKQSYRSAHFGYQAGHRFSFNSNERINLGLLVQPEMKNQISLSQNLKLTENKNVLAQIPSNSRNQPLRQTGIKKNIVDKAEDMRQQIYAKLDRMKILPDNKENVLIRQNFTMTLKKENQKITNEEVSNQNFKYLRAKKYKCVNDFISQDIPEERKETISKGLQQKVSQNQQNKLFERYPQIQNRKQHIQLTSVSRQVRQRKQFEEDRQSKWVNKVKNCQTAYQQLQRLKDQFKRHKNTVEQRSEEKQVLKNFKCIAPVKVYQHQDFIPEQETRILKLIQNRRSQQKLNEKQQTGYQRNIDSLANLTASRTQNSRSINLNETLSNSSRRSVQITLPLKYDASKVMSYSEKKSRSPQKVDKIDILSQKLQQYLKKNAQKIQYSKNFTETQDSKFNRLLAF